MKKYILFALLPIAGIIHGDEKRSAYQDWQKLDELRLKMEFSKQPLIIELISLNREVHQIKHDIRLELETCEKANNCEGSENLEKLMKEFASKALILRRKATEVNNLDEDKEEVAIFEKYQQ